MYRTQTMINPLNDSGVVLRYLVHLVPRQVNYSHYRSNVTCWEMLA